MSELRKALREFLESCEPEGDRLVALVREQVGPVPAVAMMRRSQLIAAIVALQAEHFASKGEAQVVAHLREQTAQNRAAGLHLSR